MRVEAVGDQDLPMVVIAAPDLADFARPVNWVDCMPHEGVFLGGV